MARMHWRGIAIGLGVLTFAPATVVVAEALHVEATVNVLFLLWALAFAAATWAGRRRTRAAAARRNLAPTRVDRLWEVRLGLVSVASAVGTMLLVTWVGGQAANGHLPWGAPIFQAVFLIALGVTLYAGVDVTPKQRFALWLFGLAVASGCITILLPFLVPGLIVTTLMFGGSGALFLVPSTPRP